MTQKILAILTQLYRIPLGKSYNWLVERKLSLNPSEL